MIKAFFPLVIGLILAYILNGPVEYVSSKLNKAPNPNLGFEGPKERLFAIIITYISASLLLVAIVYAFIILMLGTLPEGDILTIMQEIYDYASSSEILSSWMTKHLSASKLVGYASKIAEIIINFLLGVVASIYLIKDKEFFLMAWQKFLSIILPQRIHGIFCEISHDINIVVTTFLKGAFVDSIIVALLSSIILSILNIKHAVIIGIIGGLLNVIPYFGPFFSMVPAFFVSLANQSLSKALFAVAALFLVQQLDSNYIYPKIVGTTTGLHPLFVLLSVSVMGYFAGIIGMLIAVPIAGIIQVLLKKWANSK